MATLKRKWIFSGIAILVIVGILLLQRSRNTTPSQHIQSGNVSIVLAEDGYKPAAVTITRGTTVTFTTTRASPFWPASDLHPTHEIYPAFDPREPIEATKSWNFRFDQVGTWGMHDHISPYYTGSVTVVAPPTQ